MIVVFEGERCSNNCCQCQSSHCDADVLSCKLFNKNRHLVCCIRSVGCSRACLWFTLSMDHTWSPVVVSLVEWEKRLYRAGAHQSDQWNISDTCTTFLYWRNRSKKQLNKNLCEDSFSIEGTARTCFEVLWTLLWSRKKLLRCLRLWHSVEFSIYLSIESVIQSIEYSKNCG